MRIVSLCPSITESVIRLGKGGELVGRTKFCVHPAEVVANIERVGGTKNPKIDRILALAPDVVLMNEEENRREDADALAAAGVRVLSTFARDVPGAVRTLVEIGDAVGAAAEARPLAAAIETRASEVAARAAQRERVRFLYLIWRDPLMAVGPGTYVDALLALAGGDNVIPGDAGRYPEIPTGHVGASDAHPALVRAVPVRAATSRRAGGANRSSTVALRARRRRAPVLAWRPHPRRPRLR